MIPLDMPVQPNPTDYADRQFGGEDVAKLIRTKKNMCNGGRQMYGGVFKKFKKTTKTQIGSGQTCAPIPICASKSTEDAIQGSQRLSAWRSTAG